jgi:hypothetical protein
MSRAVRKGVEIGLVHLPHMRKLRNETVNFWTCGSADDPVRESGSAVSERISKAHREWVLATPH